MAKGPRITDQVKRTIAKVYREHPDWHAHQIRREVNRALHGVSPGLSAVQKVLADIRKAEKQIGEEKYKIEWCIGLLGEHELPAEALPVLVEIQEESRRLGKKSLNVREAVWASRLRNMIRQPKLLTHATLLGFWSRIYADYEEISKLTETKFDTSRFDKLAANHAEEYALYPFLWDAAEVDVGYVTAAKLVGLAVDLRTQALKRELSPKEQNALKMISNKNEEIGFIHPDELLTDLSADTRRILEMLQMLHLQGKELTPGKEEERRQSDERSHSQEVQG